MNSCFKDTYVRLSDKIVYIDTATVLADGNPVIGKILAPVFGKTASSSVASIVFLPLGDRERETVRTVFGETRQETEEAYLLEVTEETISIFSNSLRGHLWGACTLREHYRDGIATGYIYNVPPPFSM